MFPKADPPRAMLRDPLTFENEVLIAFSRSSVDGIAADQSALLDYAWSLGRETRVGEPEAFADIWATTEWRSHLEHIQELSRHRMWEFGLAEAGLGASRGSSLPVAPPQDFKDLVDASFGSSFNAYSPLHRAAFEGDVEAVETLLQAGSDPQRQDRLGRLPVDFAYASGDSELVKLLEAVTFPD